MFKSILLIHTYLLIVSYTTDEVWSKRNRNCAQARRRLVLLETSINITNDSPTSSLMKLRDGRLRERVPERRKVSVSPAVGGMDVFKEKSRTDRQNGYGNDFYIRNPQPEFVRMSTLIFWKHLDL